jgi:hypothetical protein
MENKSCPVELLLSSEYCQITVCMECRIVNLELPGRIILQFEIQRFIDIANSFNRATQMLKTKINPKPTLKIIEFNQKH